MTARSRSSLRTRLAVRLVILQVLAIMVVITAGLYTLLLRYGFDDAVVDIRDPEIILDAATRLPDGRLAVETTQDLDALRKRSPDFWYVLADAHGGRIVEGTVPPVFEAIAADLTGFGTTNIAGAAGNRSHAAAIRVVETAAGRLHVLTGSGQVKVAWRAVFAVASRALVPVVLTLAVVAVLGIAWIIRRELRGVQEAAGLAATIDARQRGTRLPEQDLPAEILPLVRAVNDALGRLDEGYSRQRRFLADAAHELKTPIAILHTRIETAPPSAERDRRLLLDIARLGNLAEQLLDTQRLDHSADSLTRFDLVGLARSVGADLAPVAIAAGYEFDFDAARPRHDVWGDRAALGRVIANLVQNAIAHGGGNGTITLRIDADGVLEVMDQGAGIAIEDRDRIFEPFYRARPSDSGAGLGLTIVSDVVARHGGRISIDDAGGRGTVFRVHLPEAPGDKPAARHARRASSFTSPLPPVSAPASGPAGAI